MTVIDEITEYVKSELLQGASSDVGPDDALIEDWLRLLEQEKLDFTLSFRKLSAEGSESEDSGFPATLREFLARWRARVFTQDQSTEEIVALMNRHNPLYVPRNHLVEKAIAAAYRDDWSVFERLHAVLERPFELQADAEDLAAPAQPQERVHATFCGT